MGWTKEQQLAIDLRGKDLLLGAAAGSGKTAVLVERIVQIITNKENPVDIDELLVLTFTSAAASEMRERVGIAIQKRVEEDPDNEHLQRQLVLLPKAFITTIHSFCLDVVRNNYNVIDIDPSFKIADEQEIVIIKSEILENLFEENYSKEDNEDFLNIVETYGTNKSDDKLRELILNIYNFIQSSPFPKKWLNEAINKYKINCDENLEQNFWGILLRDIVHEKLCGIRSILFLALSKCEKIDGPIEYADTINLDISLIESLIYNLNVSFESFYDCLVSVKFSTLARKKKETSNETAEVIKSLRESAKSGIKELKEKLFFTNPKKLKNDINKCYKTLKGLEKLVFEFYYLYSEVKKEKQIVDFNDLEHFCLEILLKEGSTKDKPIPSEIAISYQNKFFEIMTDEYQDSNLVQEMILSVLSKKYQGKYNRFMVGDVKQSIYRFRLAQPELFMEKYNSYSEDVSDSEVKLDLFKNFRSRSNILYGINYIFKQVMSDKLGNVVYDNKASLYPGTEFQEFDGLGTVGGEIEINVIDFEESNDALEDDLEDLSNLQLEIRCIANRIKNLFKENFHVVDKKTGEYRPIEYRDIVILFRSPNNWVRELVDEFTNLSIPVYSESQSGFYDSIEIMTIVNFLKIIDNPRNDISLISILRSAAFRFSSNDLVEIKLDSKGEFFYDKLLDYSNRFNNTILGRKIDDFNKLLLKWRDLSPDLDISSLIEVIYQDTKFYDFIGVLPGGEIRQANLRMIRELAQKFEKGSLKGLFNFIRYIENIKNNDIEIGSAKIYGEDENLVKIMSIHKSKGLEFPIVFVAGLGKRFNKTDSTGSILMDQNLGIGTQYFDYEKRVIYNTLPRAIISEKLNHETLSEELRILYVALTRAKEKLILVGGVKNIEKSIYKWSNYIDYKPIELPLYDMQSASCYFDWIMPSVSRHRDSELISQKSNILHINLNNGLFDDISSWKIKIITRNEILVEKSEDTNKSIDLKEKLNDFDCHKDYSGNRKDIFEMLNRNYKHSKLLNLPSNISISEIKRVNQEEVYSDCYQVFPENDVKFNLVDFDYENKNQNMSIQRGLAYHSIMQHLDFSKTYNIEDIKNNIDKLFDKNIIESDLKSSIDIHKIYKFFASDLGKRASKAKILKKEQAFVLGIKPQDIFGDEFSSEDENILVHGIIDCFFYEDDHIVLIDYKTDFVKKDQEQKLIERYKVQLNLYAEAIERITKTKVKNKYIYSFYLDKEIEI